MAVILQELYKVFIENDASLVEVNPLALTAKGTLIAIDAKIVLTIMLFTAIRTYRHYLTRRKKKRLKQTRKIKDSVMFIWTVISVAW